MSPHPQQVAHAASLSDPESFWIEHAQRLHWHKPPSRALTRRTKTLPSGVQHEHWSWFPDGEISTTYNCVDRHVLAGRGEDIAIVWESPVTGMVERYSYARLLDEVEVLAGVLREEGVKKGDVVIIYSMLPSPDSPSWMIPSFPFGTGGGNASVAPAMWSAQETHGIEIRPVVPRNVQIVCTH